MLENNLFPFKILENTFQGKLRALRVSRGLFHGVSRENKGFQGLQGD